MEMVGEMERERGRATERGRKERGMEEARERERVYVQQRL